MRVQFDNLHIISTHALTEGDKAYLRFDDLDSISTHALTEGDFSVLEMGHGTKTFQLTPSRRATAPI